MPSSRLALLAGILAAAVVALGGGLWVLIGRLRRSERERRHATGELNSRLSELFSLQELVYVLSDSLQLDRTVEQVVRYAMRFLDARGALVALTGETDTDPLRVAAGQGTLADYVGTTVARSDPGLVARSAGRERLELVRSTAAGPTHLFGDSYAESAAAVPLRAHGVVVGTLVIADPRGGSFQPEDIRLLSTVATQAAVVLANARFFELVRHAKEQWETAFDALSEGMAVVDEQRRVTRANRALAQLLRAPVEHVVGRDLYDALTDGSPALADMLETARSGGRPQALTLRVSGWAERCG